MRRKGSSQPVRATLISVLGALLAATALSLSGCGEDQQESSALEVEPARGIEVRRGVDRSKGTVGIAKPVSPVYRVTSAQSLRRPVTLRFPYSDADVKDPAKLRVAYRESRGEAWKWVRGEDGSGSYSVQTVRFSEWQLQEIDCRDVIGGEGEYEIDVETGEGDDPLLYACAREVDGKPGVTIFNNRPIGLEFPVLDGVRAVETGNRTIAEHAWGAVNSYQYGSPWMLLPGDGFVTLAFDSVPEEIEFRATNSAFVFDLLLSLAPHPGVAFAQCAHNVAEAARTADLSVTRSLKKLLLDGVATCAKGAVRAIFGVPGMIEKAVASVKSLSEEATVSFSSRPRALLPEVRPLKLAGPVDFDGIAPVKIGMTRSDADAAAGLHFLPGFAHETCAGMIPSPGMGGATEDDYLPGVSLMLVSEPDQDLLTQGRIARVDVLEPGYTTAAGIGIGSTEAEVRAVYRPFVRISQHTYVPGGHYLIVRSPDPALFNYRMVFETDGSQVTSFRAGKLPEVEFVEHCV